VIGVAPTPDIWGSFKDIPSHGRIGDGPLSSFFDSINNMFNIIAEREYNEGHPFKAKFIYFLDILGFVDHDDSSSFDSSLSEFKKALNALDDYIKNIDPDLYSKTSYGKVFKKYYKGNMYQALVGLLNPSNNGFNLVKAGQKLPTGSQELWTEGVSLMIDANTFWEAHESGELWGYIK
jgi:hypothetical protein